MMMLKGELFSQMGSAIGTFMLIWAMVNQYVPESFRRKIYSISRKIASLFDPYIHITFHEYSAGHFKRSEAYTAVENYLSDRTITQAKRLKADLSQNKKSVVLTMDDHQELTDEFLSVKLLWSKIKTPSSQQTISFYPQGDAKRSYCLTFHKSHRSIVVDSYLNHVMKQGKEIQIRKRQRKLFTNSSGDNGYGYKKGKWSHVVFEHPATFETLAMDPAKKKEIIDDLVAFSESKEYYARIGKAWKRGYLLFGPPGTGKSTMIAAIANFLNYDVYDLELTTVKDNTELRKLLIETSSKSIIVIEDIDCSLQLTGQRKDEKEDDDDKKKEDEDGEEKKNPIEKKKKEDEKKIRSEVTLSGLLNFIDGLWSACGDQRIIIFTTNHVDKLDPALIRTGRMDKHVEMSYCGFEAFMVLAKNYLGIEEHRLFDKIGEMLEEVEITPADVAENLMPKSMVRDAEASLGMLVGALEKAKEEMKKKKDEAKAKQEAEEVKKDEAEAELGEDKETEAEKGKEEDDEEVLAPSQTKLN